MMRVRTTSRATELALIAISAACVMLAGCSASRQVEVAKLGPANEVAVYDKGGPAFERTVAEGSEEDRAVAVWLQSHPDGWQVDVVTYAPARYLRGANFTLNFHTDRCILNYRAADGGDWAQVSRPMGEGDAVPDVFAPPR